MRWHRDLTGGDVSTAHALLNQHSRYVEGGVDRCAGLHGAHAQAPRWPCSQASWAISALAAEDRGEVPA
ncbi:hypothetical protein [Cryptosporangium arvum]|uniref:Uncharacterized protein n=1 Tax=Cryptosporangium arvum DSM 44712 TaxID=927661 RepID=A0A010ZMW7_9ACTN|nr:hypothetical protein [Cryptosporangium arvum]EXG80029.1 hypothetical protein CryarDRAFT_1088 [Cryptosporangium arvum DSM 44712]